MESRHGGWTSREKEENQVKAYISLRFSAKSLSSGSSVPKLRQWYRAKELNMFFKLVPQHCE